MVSIHEEKDCEKMKTKILALAVAVSFSLFGATRTETNVNSADHVDASGNLAYTAVVDGETVSFDSGAGIVYGT